MLEERGERGRGDHPRVPKVCRQEVKGKCCGLPKNPSQLGLVAFQSILGSFPATPVSWHPAELSREEQAGPETGRKQGEA